MCLWFPNAVLAVTFGGFLNVSLRASTAQLGFDAYSNTTITILGVLSQTFYLDQAYSNEDGVRSHEFLFLRKCSFL